MTDPTDPTAPGAPGEPTMSNDPTEALVRDALAARATEVQPGEPDAAVLAAAVRADELARRRRARLLVGTAAAAIVLLAATAGVLALRDDGPAQVVTGDGSTSSEAPTTTRPEPATTKATFTAADTTTSAAPPTTTAPATTTAPPVTTTMVAPLPGASTQPRSGGGHGEVPALLTDVRIGCGPGSDRVVFEFRDDALPSWQVAYTSRPVTMDGSGEEVTVAGDAVLQVRFEGAAGHEPQGEQYVPTYPGPSRVPAGCPEVLDVVETGEFEAIYNWTIGLTAERGFVVATLDGPSRLVIDISHI